MYMPCMMLLCLLLLQVHHMHLYAIVVPSLHRWPESSSRYACASNRTNSAQNGCCVLHFIVIFDPNLILDGSACAVHAASLVARMHVARKYIVTRPYLQVSHCSFGLKYSINFIHFVEAFWFWAPKISKIFPLPRGWCETWDLKSGPHKR